MNAADFCGPTGLNVFLRKNIKELKAEEWAEDTKCKQSVF